MEVARQQIAAHNNDYNKQSCDHPFYQGQTLTGTAVNKRHALVQPMKHESAISEASDNDEKTENKHELDQHEHQKPAYVETSLDDLIYSDSGEASGQSEDEENERRLIERLKFEHQQQQQMRQLEQQQQRQQAELARQQQQQATQVICFHDTSHEQHRSSGAQQQQQGKVDSQGALVAAEEPAPQVPVRRSSRQAADESYSLHHRRVIGASARQARAPPPAKFDAQCRPDAHDDDGEEFEYEDYEDDDDDESTLPPPPRLHAVSSGVLASAATRPPLPPPPPPPSQASHVRGANHARAAAKQPPPPPPPRTRSSSQRQAPKNIWSPSSSSLASSSLSSEPELERAPTLRASEPALIDATGSDGASDGKGHTGASEEEEATIVELHLKSNAENINEQQQRAAGKEQQQQVRAVENGKDATSLGALLSNDDNNERALAIKAQAPAAADKSSSCVMQQQPQQQGNKTTDELFTPPPPPPIELVQANSPPPLLQQQKGNLRSFSISTPINLTIQQQQQRQLLISLDGASKSSSGSSQQTAAPSRSSNVLSSFVGGRQVSGRSPGGQTRSFSIAEGAGRLPALGVAGGAPHTEEACQLPGQFATNKFDGDENKRVSARASSEAAVGQIISGRPLETRESTRMAVEHTKHKQQQQQEPIERLCDSTPLLSRKQASDGNADDERDSRALLAAVASGGEVLPAATADQLCAITASEHGQNENENINKQKQNQEEDREKEEKERMATLNSNGEGQYQKEPDDDDDEELQYQRSDLDLENEKFQRLSSYEKQERTRIEETLTRKTSTTSTSKTTTTRSTSRPAQGASNVPHASSSTTFPTGQNNTTNSQSTAANQPAQQAGQNNLKEEWFKQMYKQMHRPTSATAEKSLLDAVNQQQQAADSASSNLIKIKLKSPSANYHFEPSYFSEEDLERRSVSPAGTRPGNICDYLPGESSISQHERNLLLYHKLIDHINRVFSSVLHAQDAPALTSRSTNTLATLHKTKDYQQQQAAAHACHQHAYKLSAYYEPDEYRARSHSMRRSRIRRRSSSGANSKKRKQLAQSQSGPQTPATKSTAATAAACSPGYHIRSARLKDEPADTTTTSSEGAHEKRCVFNRLLVRPLASQEGRDSEVDDHVPDAGHRNELINDDEDAITSAEQRDPRKQYVAVQQGHDIPLKGLRKPAPQPNIYKDQVFDDKSTINIHYKTPVQASRLLKMNTLNEYELNRIKRFYAQELANKRLQRSRSTRLSAGASAKHLAHRYQQSDQFGGDARPLSFRGGVSGFVPARPDENSAASSATTTTDAIIDLKRYNHALTTKRKFQRANQRRRTSGSGGGAKFGRALYDFCATNEGELSIKRGELAEILEVLDGNDWARVEDCQSGLQGLVPLSYLDYNIGCAVARRDVSSTTTAAASSSRASSRMGTATESHLHAHAPAGPRLLAMSKGEPIALIRRLDGHLYEASNTHQATGLVWSTDLDIIKQPPSSGAASGRIYQEAVATTVAPNDNLNFGYGEFTDDEEEEDDADLEDKEMFACLRSICDDLDTGRRRRQQQTASSCQRAAVPPLDQLTERRRRARSASGALNEQQQHQQYRTQQQYCTMSRSQRQRMQTATCQQQHQQQVQDQHQQAPDQCNCWLASCQSAAAVPNVASRPPPVRSSSSPQISLQAAAAAGSHHQRERATPQQQQQARSDTAAVAGVLPRLCRARYAYEPRQRDELELVPGDVLVVAQECDDGWLIGHSYASKQMGTFPGNFVEPI